MTAKAASQNTEFRTGREHRYNRSGPAAWIFSHAVRYPLLPLAALLAAVLNNFSYSGIQLLMGRGFGIVSRPGWEFEALLRVVLFIGALGLGQGVFGLIRNFAVEFMAQRVERDARDELYAALLGKSQAFHGRQRIGDVMARATNDVHLLNTMFSPGIMLLIDSFMALVAPLVLIAVLNWRLLAVPGLFVVLLVVTVRDYTRRLGPVVGAEREQFGTLNAELEEGIAGVEIIKSNAREKNEWEKFSAAARRYRDLYVKQGIVQSKYFPLLAYTACFVLAFLHGLYLYTQKIIEIDAFVGFLGLMNALRFPTFISLYSFQLVQMGIAGAGRILELVTGRTELDENRGGVSRPIRGLVEYRDVGFAYGGKPCLEALSFRVEPGETIAIVGKTGSGKTTLTRLLNRMYDSGSGAILVDGVDVRDWNMESLRQQIASIEQDVFLFSRSIAENIAFGCPGVGREKIESVAKAACAHEFIMEFKDGYETVIGERGVTLSGGQKQRLAIARAFLADPRILVLDDSTSAIDSKTEDEIQRAMRRVSRERTTFIITHRLSQIRWASRVLVLEAGRRAAFGTHDELMRASPEYARIFRRN